MGCGIEDMEVGDVLGRKTMEGASILKEDEESLVIGVSREKTISDSVR